MEEVEAIKRIIPILKDKGYNSISRSPILPALSWSFDLVAESSDKVLALEYRRNDKIPDSFLERMQNIKRYKKRLFIYLIFDKRPRETSISLLNKFGIGVMIFQNNKLYSLSDSKDFSKSSESKTVSRIRTNKKKQKKVVKEKTMHQIWVYACSKLYETDDRTPCKERIIIHRVINRFKKMKVPIECVLVEDDMSYGKKFRKKMLEKLKTCHIFIGAINERYGSNIEYEIKTIFRMKNDNWLILILKKNMKLDELDKRQSRLIDYIEKQTGHIPYNNFKEFEENVQSNLFKMINRLYGLNKSKPPYFF